MLLPLFSFGILLQLLILGTPHTKSVTKHKDNLQPQIDKRRTLLCHCGDGNLADDIETTKQRAQGNGMQLSKMME
jgi:hypothetical protein